MATEIFWYDRVRSGSKPYQGEVVLTYNLESPRFVAYTPLAGLSAINAEYDRRTRQRLQAIDNTYYPAAVVDFRQRQRGDFPFAPYDIRSQYRVTYSDDCIISLYTDDYQYTGGAHGTTTRTGDTWNARTGQELPLAALFPSGTDYTARLEAAVLAQVAVQQRQPDSIYFDDTADLVRQTFDPANYYLTPTGIVVFFQQYAIAPYAAGIRTFEIPYDEVGARAPRC